MPSTVQAGAQLGGDPGLGDGAGTGAPGVCTCTRGGWWLPAQTGVRLVLTFSVMSIFKHIHE